MLRRGPHFALTVLISALLCVVMPACGGNKGCEGPALNLEKLDAAKRSLQGSGPRGFLVLPNPIDATRRSQATATDNTTISAGSLISLPALVLPQRLENSFLKIRIKDITDAISSLAAPNSAGEYKFELTDPHYSETMAYHSLVTIQAYVEALGFSVVQTRPLYVMVRATDAGGDDVVNAIYDHAYLNPSAPRTMKLYGNTKFAPGMDRDMYWHEFGHLFNESVTREVGMDFAGDNGARYNFGSALHECLADHLAQSVANKSYIGKWIARNIEGFAVGQPLRSAVDTDGRRSRYADVALVAKDGSSPERYAVAEVCTRMLWEIRQSFVDADPKMGSMYSDRMIFSAVSLLQRDTTMKAFQESLLKADEELHCGGHESSIKQAFENRGFDEARDTLSTKLKLEVNPQAFNFSSTSSTPIAMAPGASVIFQVRITNQSGQTARNVRVLFESGDQALIPTTYLQGYGDVAARSSIEVATGNGLDLGWAVGGEIDRNARRGTKLRYRLRLQVENGEETLVQGEISL